MNIGVEVLPCRWFGDDQLIMHVRIQFCVNKFVLILDVSERLVVRNLSLFGTAFIVFGPHIEVVC